MKKGILFLLLGLIIAGILIAGCTTTTPTTKPTPVPTTVAPQLKSIVDTAVADGRFTTLVAAVKAAKLDGALSGPGPYTVFAPTDDAFKNLPPGTVETLLKDPEGQLKQILLYHVVDGKVMAADVVKLTSAKTLQGSNVNITVTNGVVKVNDATVKITDIQTSNGVIHVIDKVLIPPK
jgi:transforming growth factor-beta-induced protein